MYYFYNRGVGVKGVDDPLQFYILYKRQILLKESCNYPISFTNISLTAFVNMLNQSTLILFSHPTNYGPNWAWKLLKHLFISKPETKMLWFFFKYWGRYLRYCYHLSFFLWVITRKEMSRQLKTFGWQLLGYLKENYKGGGLPPHTEIGLTILFHVFLNMITQKRIR